MPENVIISEDYRKLTVPQNQLILGCVGDAWVRRVYFTAPRYCDDTDLSGYDFTVQFINNANESDLYEVEDLAVEEDALTFSWLVSPIACAVVGNTGVSIVASNVDAQTGETLNRFVTTTFEWQVLPSTTAEGGELIEAQSYVEMRIAEWQAEIDEAISKTNYRSYDTVADMQADDTLSDGMTAHTLGFHAAGDGGAAWYKVESTGTANGMDILAVSNSLVAVLVPSNEGYYANQLGMKNDNVTDNASILSAFLSIHPYATIYFDSGVYRFSPIVIANNSYTPGFSLIGKNYSFPNVRLDNASEIDYQTFYNVDSENVTVFAPIGDQASLFDLQVMSNVTMKNIMFTSIADNSLYEITSGLLKLHRVVFSNFENLHFMYIHGTPLVSYNSYEIRFNSNDFRVCVPNGVPSEHGCIEFVTGEGNPGVNSSAWQISDVNFEAVICHWLYVNGARVQNITLSNVIGESQSFNFGLYTTTETTHSDFPDIPIDRSLSVIGFDNTTVSYDGFVFESISIDNLGLFYYTNSSTNLVYGMNSIVSTKDDCTFQVVINAIQISNPSVNTYIYSGSNELSGYRKKLSCKNISFDISNPINIACVRGTLSYADFDNSLFMVTNLGNNYLQNDDLFVYQPHEYNTGARMWVNSTRNKYELSRLTPAESTDLNNAAYYFSALGITKVVVVAKPGSNLTVKRKTNYEENLATKDSASLFDVYTLTNPSPHSAAYANIIISGDGEHVDEIFRIMVS